jgi:recombination protein RecA
MSPSLRKLEDVVSMARAIRAELARRPHAGWTLADLAGRLGELSGSGATAVLTLAFALVLEAQHQGEPVAWITTTESSFYPPDAAEGGVDLDALLVVRVLDARGAARAADRLVRSGAFGLVVLDLRSAEVPTPLQMRLAGLAQKYQTAVLCLTEKGDAAPSLGSLVCLRVHAQRKKLSKDQFSCELTVLKDKRRGPTWKYTEGCRGPAGLR